VAAGADRREVVVAARAPREDVAHLVDLDRATCRLAPLHEQVAALLVEVGQGKPAHTAFRRGTDLGHFHQAAPQTVAVDFQFCHCMLLCASTRFDLCTHNKRASTAAAQHATNVPV